MCKCHVLIKKQKNKIIEYIFSKTVKKLQDIQSAKSQKNSDSWSVSAKMLPSEGEQTSSATDVTSLRNNDKRRSLLQITPFSLQY